MKTIFALCLCVACYFLPAQQRNIDSLLTLIAKDKNDTLKIQHMDYLGYEYIKLQRFDTAYVKLQEAIRLGSSLLKEHGTKTDLIHKVLTRGVASAYHFLGVSFYYQSSFDSAVFNFSTGLKLNTEIGNKRGMSKGYLNLGAIYYNFGNYDKALENYIATLKISDELQDKETEAGAYNNIGSIYMAQVNNSKALYYFKEGLKIYLELNNKAGISNTYMNLGNVYGQLKEKQKAIENLNAALKIKEELGSAQGMAEAHANIGHVFWEAKDYENALKSYFTAYGIYEGMNNAQGLAFCNTYIGSIYADAQQFTKALPYLNKGLAQSKEMGISSMIQEAYSGLAETYAATGNYKMAYEAHIEYGKVRDTLYNQNRVKQMAEMDARYQGEKKEQQLQLLKTEQEKEREVAQQKSRIQLIIIAAVVLGLLLVAVFAVFINRALKTTKHQKDIIEVKQKEILDSIHYAKKIQTALMTNEKYIDNTLNRMQK